MVASCCSVVLRSIRRVANLFLPMTRVPLGLVQVVPQYGWGTLCVMVASLVASNLFLKAGHCWALVWRMDFMKSSFWEVQDSALGWRLRKKAISLASLAVGASVMSAARLGIPWWRALEAW